MRILITCLLGLESCIKKELLNLGYSHEIIKLEDGQVSLEFADMNFDLILQQLIKLNIYIRTGERVLLEIKRATVTNYEDLFDFVYNCHWESLVPDDFFVEVKFYSLKSKIYGENASKSLCKKAIIKRLIDKKYMSQVYINESKDKGRFRVHISFRNDVLSLSIDTSGVSLYKRGYKVLSGEAPIRETLAAAILQLSKFEPFSDELLYDPFCGSGTIAIEAAMIATNTPPGMYRKFSFMSFPFYDERVFRELHLQAKRNLDLDKPEDIFIYASDYDDEVLSIAKDNAKIANVSDFINFYNADFLNNSSFYPIHKSPYKKYLIVSNPPYGDRLSDRNTVKHLHQVMAKRLTEGTYLKKGYRLSIITSDEKFESDFGYQADKRRKLYNGMKEAHLYHFFRQVR